MFQEGHNKIGGRKKGSNNKHTKAFKELITETFQALEKDNKHGLLKWAKQNENDFYKICTKLIPTEITGTSGEALFTLNIDNKQLSTPSTNGVSTRDN